MSPRPLQFFILECGGCEAVCVTSLARKTWCMNVCCLSNMSEGAYRYGGVYGFKVLVF
jgi:hypothetical protein